MSSSEQINNKNGEVPVVFASDQRGVLPLSVAAWSVVENAAPETQYLIIILSDGIEAESQKKISELMKKAGDRHRVEFIDIENVVPADVKVTELWPRAAWARIFLPDLLPNVSHIIYLDIDTLTCADLKSLYNMSMGDNALGAVIEARSGEGTHFNERLKLPLDCVGYFNTGVLLMNLEVFRRDDLSRKVMEFAKEHFESLHYPDQDALNGALHDRVVWLHPRWNWNGGLTRAMLRSKLTDHLWRGGFTPKQCLESALYPGILHYRGVKKPWFYNYDFEGKRYEDCMVRAGLVERLPLPGWTVRKVIKNKYYSIGFAFTRAKIRRLARRFGVTQAPSSNELES